MLRLKSLNILYLFKKKNYKKIKYKNLGNIQTIIIQKIICNIFIVILKIH